MSLAARPLKPVTPSKFVTPEKVCTRGGDPNVEILPLGGTPRGMKNGAGVKLKLLGGAGVETVPVMRDQRNITEFTLAAAIVLPLAVVKLLGGT